MFALEFTGEVGADYSHSYNVKMDREYTVMTFIEDILSSRPNDSGLIETEDGDIIAEYRNGELEPTYKLKDLGNETVVGVTSSGCYNCMNYTVQLETQIEKYLNGKLQPVRRTVK